MTLRIIFFLSVLFPSTPDGAVALSPNMANLVVLNQHLAIPKPFGPIDNGVDVFEEYVAMQLGPLGLTCHFIDDWLWYHDVRGEIHCGTQVLRAHPVDVPWWQKE